MPSLDLPSLKKRIADRRLGPVHLFVGEDLTLVDRMVEAVESTVDPGDRPFAVERVHAGEPGGSPVEFIGAVRMPPMLGDRRIVIVLRAERLLKPKRSSKAAQDDEGVDETAAEEGIDGGPIEEYLEGPVSSNTLLFVATEVDRSRRLTKRVVEKAFVTEFLGLGAGSAAGARDARRTATEWLQEELARAGRTIEVEAARLLVARSANDINKLRGDVERLLLFTEGRNRVSTDDVMEVVSEDSSVDDEWAVVNAIADGDPARALVEAGRRLDRGDSVHALVGQLRWWVSARLAEADPSRVKPALEALLRTDLALKSSGGEERILVERLVAELTGRPVSQRGGGWGRR